jgi:UDP-N-acetylmuramoyl-tripeptide--D-alanyl-D-alanine ligase
MSDPGDFARFHPPGRLGAAEILAATGGRLLAGPVDGTLGFCTDSRAMSDGSVFVAIRGEVHDGHRFVRDTLAAHRAGALVQEGRAAVDTGAGTLSVDGGEPLALASLGGPVLAVADPLAAFGAIGRAFLWKHGPAVVAVTGSVGKTTTRAMIASILARLGPGLQTEGNFNNRIGVPLTLLQLRADQRWACLELGMSEPGEIRDLAALCRPRVRVITEVAPAHLQFFDSVEGIADAKGELFEAALPGDTLVFPLDNPLQRRFPRPRGTLPVPFSMEPESGAPVRLLSVDDRGLRGSRARISVHGHAFDIEIAVPGLHSVHDALAAAAAAWAMGADADAIQEGLATAEPPGRRMKTVVLGGVTILDDAYNANPASVAAALRTLASLPSDGRRAAALGDMLELGPSGPALHEDVGRLAAELGLSLLVGAGPLMSHAVDAARAAAGRRLEARAVPDAAAAARVLRDWLRPGDLLLLKGSRGMRMEETLRILQDDAPAERHAPGKGR